MDQVITHVSAREFLAGITACTLVIYSPKSNELYPCTNLNNPNLVFKSSHDLDYDSPLQNVDGFKQVIGFGGGTAIDFAKYYANSWQILCIAIPTMLSTNVFATNKSAVTKRGVKRTESTVLPEQIIYDSKLLEQTPEITVCGLADVLSIHTALKDWELAGSEPILPGIYAWAKALLSSAMELIKIPLQQGEEFLSSYTHRAFSLLCSAGYITNEYGNGRPESGSEHILAKSIEEELSGDIPHAYSVATGILISTILQNNTRDAVDALKMAGVYTKVRKSKITPEVLRAALEQVTPRVDRYSIYDKVCPLSQETINHLMSIAEQNIWD